MSDNSDNSGVFLALIYVFVFGVMPFYAIYKDIQAHKMAWAVIDFLVFPLGALRGLMYLFGG